jgi:phosphoserine phosphatase
LVAIKEMTENFPDLTVRENCQVKRLFLCRHGETAVNASGVLQGRGVDVGLNEKGISQAEALANRLKDEEIDIIFCSKLIVCLCR